jgi:hypothetical protein
VTWSAFAGPELVNRKLSVPAPPVSASLPSPPFSRSLPPRPRIASPPPEPVIVSLAVLSPPRIAAMPVSLVPEKSQTLCTELLPAMVTLAWPPPSIASTLFAPP